MATVPRLFIFRGVSGLTGEQWCSSNVAKRILIIEAGDVDRDQT